MKPPCGGAAPKAVERVVGLLGRWAGEEDLAQRRERPLHPSVPHDECNDAHTYYEHHQSGPSEDKLQSRASPCIGKINHARPDEE